MKKLYKNLLIIILLGLNMFLVYSNIEKQNRIKDIQSENNQIKTSNFIKNKIGDQFYFKSKANLSIRNNVALVVFIPAQSCIICLKKEIKYINKIWDSFSSHLSVVYAGDERSNLLERFDIHFKYKVVDSYSKYFSEDITLKNPTSFLIFNKKLVFDVHTAEPANDMKSKLFFDRVFALFQSYPKM